jgi:hypothetical protein
LWGSWVIVGLAGSKIPYQIPRTWIKNIW